MLLLFQDIVQGWLRREFGTSKTNELMTALIDGDTLTFGERLKQLTGAILSYYDTGGKNPERVYHTFVLGLLAHLTDRYTIRSNRESGRSGAPVGRYDVMMLPKHKGDRGIIIEFKVAATPDQLDEVLDGALAQIETRHYANELKTAGVVHYSEIAVAFCGKHVAVRARHLPG